MTVSGKPAAERETTPRRRMRIAVLAALIRFALRILRWTVRPVVGSDGEPLLAAFARGERVLVAFWHGQLALAQLAYPGRRMCIQVSRHTDGEIIARAVAPLGIRSARGSATRGGVASVRQMLRAFEEGYDLAAACDGPRGPRHRVKPGVVQLAAATGAPLHPIAAAPRWRWIAGRSWDRFVVPLPFTRIHYVAGEPLQIRRDAPPAEIEEARLVLENRLRDLTARAEALAGHAGAR